MAQEPQAPKTLTGLQYYINPTGGAGLELPLTTNPIIYCRDHMKQMKISLHKSGTQFVAFTEQSDIKMTGNSRPPTGEAFGFCAGGFDSAGVAYLLPFPAQVEKDESGKLSTIAPRFGD